MPETTPPAPIDVYWRISMHGDQPSLRAWQDTRGDWLPTAPGSITPALRDGAEDGYTYLDHMLDVARAAEASGFTGALLPNFPSTDDPWATAAALAAETSTFRFMVAFQPGFLHPVSAARLSASLQRATGGRLVYNVITGGGGASQLWWGDKVEHDDRYARTAEFLDTLRGLWSASAAGETYTARGRFYDVEDAILPPALAAQPVPEIYFSGSSGAAIDAAGRHADHYLSWLEPFDGLREKFAAVREHSAASGRTPKFAVRVDVVARETEAEAWREIEQGWENVDVRSALARYGPGDSVGAARGQAFVEALPGGTGTYRDLEAEPNVWGGFHLLRAGPAFGLVGSYDQVAARLDELIDLGVDSFVLAAPPHLEEAYRVGENVLPRLTRRTPSGFLHYPVATRS